MKSDRPRDTLIPSGLIVEIQAAAEEEQRAPAELVGEADCAVLVGAALVPQG
jgi:hypothetical protein